MKKQIGKVIGLTVFICAIFWVYTQWDLKKFKKSLPKALPVQSEKSETASAQQGDFPQEAAEVSLPVPDTPLETSIPITPEQLFDVKSVKEVPPTDDLALENLFDTFPEESPADAITSGDFMDVTEGAPYDQVLVEKGFEDYNAYLETDSKYAYQRLDDAFREQYGDDSDIDIIVETVRRSNEDTLTIDDAIYHTEAMIRLVSKIGPPEAVAVIADTLEYFREGKQLSLELGEDTVHLLNFRFHVGE